MLKCVCFVCVCCGCLGKEHVIYSDQWGTCQGNWAPSVYFSPVLLSFFSCWTYSLHYSRFLLKFSHFSVMYSGTLWLSFYLSIYLAMSPQGSKDGNVRWLLHIPATCFTYCVYLIQPLLYTHSHQTCIHSTHATHPTHQISIHLLNVTEWLTLKIIKGFQPNPE